MSLRQAYEMVIMHQLELLEETGRWGFADGHKEEIVKALSDEPDFHEDVTEAIEEHLETFGENYGLF